MVDANESVMNLIKGSAGASNLAPSPTVMPDQPDEAPPMASPMSTPEPKAGNKEGARINVQMAMDLLQQSLPAFGFDSIEGKAILEIVKKMGSTFGMREAQTRELVPAEILQMIQTLPQAGGASPEQRVAASAPTPGLQQRPQPM
jgi:hypothetical protein